MATTQMYLYGWIFGEIMVRGLAIAKLMVQLILRQFHQAKK